MQRFSLTERIPVFPPSTSIKINLAESIGSTFSHCFLSQGIMTCTSKQCVPSKKINSIVKTSIKHLTEKKKSAQSMSIITGTQLRVVLFLLQECVRRGKGM